MLVDLARGKAVLAAAGPPVANDSEWVICFKETGIPLADASPVSFAGQQMSFAWRSHFVAASTNPLTASARTEADAKGWVLFELSATPTAGAPEAMLSLLRE